jgi:hypothetical protein
MAGCSNDRFRNSCERTTGAMAEEEALPEEAELGRLRDRSGWRQDPPLPHGGGTRFPPMRRFE